jgi:methionine--tRNA ligase beta chain
MEKEDIHEKDLEYLARCQRAAAYCAEKLGWKTVECTRDGEMRPIGDIQAEIYYQAQKRSALVSLNVTNVSDRPLTFPDWKEMEELGKISEAALAAAQGKVLEHKDEIVYDDFAKLELRAAKVLECEKVPKADKLLRMQLDVGDRKMQVLSGIAQYYTPEEMVGKMVVWVANLAPRKLRGFDSYGMILCAEKPNGDYALLSVPEGVEPGAEVS